MFRRLSVLRDVSENNFVSRKRIWQQIIQRTFSSVFLGITWGGSTRIVMPRMMDGCLIPHYMEEELESSALPPPPPCHQPLLTQGLGGGNPHGRRRGGGAEQACTSCLCHIQYSLAGAENDSLPPTPLKMSLHVS